MPLHDPRRCPASAPKLRPSLSNNAAPPLYDCQCWTITSAYFGSSSISRAWRPVFSHAIEGEPEPPKGAPVRGGMRARAGRLLQPASPEPGRSAGQRPAGWCAQALAKARRERSEATKVLGDPAVRVPREDDAVPTVNRRSAGRSGSAARLRRSGPTTASPSWTRTPARTSRLVLLPSPVG
jgi:hypothetical protein